MAEATLEICFGLDDTEPVSLLFADDMTDSGPPWLKQGDKNPLVCSRVWWEVI
jgi:hypothetical protein